MRFSAKQLDPTLRSRFEIVPDRDMLKGLVKELIYEGFRNFKDLLEAHNKGLDITQFNMKTKRKKTSTPE